MQPGMSKNQYENNLHVRWPAHSFNLELNLQDLWRERRAPSGFQCSMQEAVGDLGLENFKFTKYIKEKFKYV
jgi:hypothetical protein